MLRHGWDTDCGQYRHELGAVVAFRGSPKRGAAEATVIEGVASTDGRRRSGWRGGAAQHIDHLDRYGYEMANYAASKGIAPNGHHLIYNADCEWTLRMLDQRGTSANCCVSAERTLDEEETVTAAVWTSRHQFILQHFKSFSMTIQKLVVQKHKFFNSMAASMTGRVSTARALEISSFEGGHRLEFVKK